jgi:2,5-diamino-6-(ribosylamino)-4(3H)-pyrimidinone 5'-phosphate reductase
MEKIIQSDNSNPLEDRKMHPRIILHNSISIDGSLTGFDVNMGLHYQIAGEYEPEAHLIGSNTVKTGIEVYGDGVPPEEKGDFEKPARDEKLPYWVVPDTRASLKGMLHTMRRFEFCRDMIILVSETTPKDYLEHLKQRNYDYHVVGSDHIDIEKALELLSNKYDVKTILADTGSKLGNILISKGLVSEISILVHPVIVGKKSLNMFEYIDENVKLSLLKSQAMDYGIIWLTFAPEL